ncbi:hypothetical protein EJB05_47525, partial [Eragrostis curvula]
MESSGESRSRAAVGGKRRSSDCEEEFGDLIYCCPPPLHREAPWVDPRATLLSRRRHTATLLVRLVEQLVGSLDLLARPGLGARVSEPLAASASSSGNDHCVPTPRGQGCGPARSAGCWG